MVFIPRKKTDMPAIVVELKYNKSPDTAIEQIKNKEYVQRLKGYTGDIILVGISYENNDSGKDGYQNHRCNIEKMTIVEEDCRVIFRGEDVIIAEM